MINWSRVTPPLVSGVTSPFRKEICLLYGILSNFV
jgi:hypothetical protein